MSFAGHPERTVRFREPDGTRYGILRLCRPFEAFMIHHEPKLANDQKPISQKIKSKLILILMIKVQ